MYCVDYYNINLQIISEIIVLDKVDTFFFLTMIVMSFSLSLLIWLSILRDTFEFCLFKFSYFDTHSRITLQRTTRVKVVVVVKINIFYSYKKNTTCFSQHGLK